MADGDAAEETWQDADAPVADEAPSIAVPVISSTPKVRLRLGGEPLERRRPLSTKAFAALPPPPVPELVEKAPTSGATFVERPLEPTLKRGRGMHVLGFVSVVSQPPKTPSKMVEELPKTPSKIAEQPACVGGGVGDSNGDHSRKHDGYRQMHGSYRNYYGYRPGGGDPDSLDSRLRALVGALGKDCLEGLKVLDIGCNSGEISLAVARHLGTRRVVGCDIDPELVDAAIASRDALASGSKSVPSKRGGECKVTFRAEDFLEGPMRRTASGDVEQFDALLCLSVTKWVHFARGDAGIRKLFSRAFKSLRPGGIFVLEPQEWSSYKKKRYLNPKIRQTVAGIEMRPDAFDGFLTGIGFRHTATIAPPAEGPQGFRRSVRVFTKPADDVAEAKEELEQPEGRRSRGKRSCGGHDEGNAREGEAEEKQDPAESPREKKRRKA